MTTKSKNTPPLPKGWVEFITPFANTIDMSVEDVTQALHKVVGKPGEEAISLLKDAQTGATNEEIASVFTDTASAVLRKAVQKHLREVAAVEPAVNPALSLDMLPSPKSDESFVEALKVGGVSKVGPTDVEAGVKAALAAKVDFFGIPKKIELAMEEHAAITEEPHGDAYYDVVKMITKRDYAEIFAALKVPASAVNQTKRNRFVEQISTILWPAIYGFNNQLSGWFDTWMKASGNPAILMQALSGAVSGAVSGGQSIAPAMTVPDTEPLRIAADEVIDRINRAYAGVGIPAARALAYEATQIKELLAKPEIQGLVGATSRELMLKQLGINVSANFVSMEHSVVKYMLAILELGKQPKGTPQEQAYLNSLYQLGASIPWDKLVKTSQVA